MSILLDGKAIPIQSLLFVFSVAAASLTCHGDWPSTSWNLKPFLQPWNTFLIFKKLNYECILIWFPHNVNVADVNNGRRLNPSHRCCIESFLSMVEFESQSLWECRNFTNPLSNGQGSVGQCHALLPVTWRCHPLYFFYFPYTMASLVYIWKQQAGQERSLQNAKSLLLQGS